MKRYTEQEVNAFRNEFEAILKLANEQSSANEVSGEFSDYLMPNMQYVKFDALKKEDWPHGIEENSVYLTFVIYLEAKKVKVSHKCGHVYLSPKDKETERYKHLAMRSMTEIAQTDYKVKKFRLQGYKSTEDLCGKMEKYFKAVMDAISKYSGGYPYKRGV